MKILNVMGAVLVALAAAACSQSDAGPAAATPAAAVAASDATADVARTPEPTRPASRAAVATGVTVSDVGIARTDADAGVELEVTGTIENQAKEAVYGVNLAVTFLSDDGSTLGGHTTQQYFQPPLASGKAQALVLRIPAVGGAIEKATDVDVVVLNLVREGESPDGWRPLDPNNLPEPRVVKGKGEDAAPPSAAAAAD